MHRLTIVPTEIGWIGIASLAGCITRVKMGFRSQLDLIQSFTDLDFDMPDVPGSEEARWLELLGRHASGQRVELNELPIDLSPFTPFQREVLEACRAIPYGQTRTYGDLAQIVGRPRAARAVGNVMRGNRYPLIVPCHRVVGINGMCGFSAPDGVVLKRKLLEIEGAPVVARNNHQVQDASKKGRRMRASHLASRVCS